MLAALWAGGRLSTRDSWAERGISATEISIEQALLGLAPTHDGIQHSGERIEERFIRITVANQHRYERLIQLLLSHTLLLQLPRNCNE
jgi:hypothetical protein